MFRKFDILFAKIYPIGKVVRKILNLGPQFVISLEERTHFGDKKEEICLCSSNDIVTRSGILETLISQLSLESIKFLYIF